MRLDIRDMLAKLDAYLDYAQVQALAGLDAATTGVEEVMRGTTAHGDITGATRAGYRAYAVGAGRTGATELSGAAAIVDALNPGHSAAASGTLGAQSIGVILTCPTDYQYKLETERAGAKAVLGPTLAAYRDELTQRAARGS